MSEVPGAVFPQSSSRSNLPHPYFGICASTRVHMHRYMWGSELPDQVWDKFPCRPKHYNAIALSLMLTVSLKSSFIWHLYFLGGSPLCPASNYKTRHPCNRLSHVELLSLQAHWTIISLQIAACRPSHLEGKGMRAPSVFLNRPTGLLKFGNFLLWISLPLLLLLFLKNGAYFMSLLSGNIHWQANNKNNNKKDNNNKVMGDIWKGELGWKGRST